MSRSCEPLAILRGPMPCTSQFAARRTGHPLGLKLCSQQLTASCSSAVCMGFCCLGAAQHARPCLPRLTCQGCLVACAATTELTELGPKL